MPQPDTEAWPGPFVDALERVREADDRATLAKLRRGLTDHAAECEMWVYGHLRGALSEHEEPALLTAALFATHPQKGGRGSLGAAFRRMRTETSAESLDKRFAVLIDSHPDELPARLRQAVSLLKSQEVPVDWRRLLSDLLDWGGPRRPVQRTWARDYWAVQAAGAEDPGNTAEPATAKGE
jgi:CRISPR system Cascade subunit CasB